MLIARTFIEELLTNSNHLTMFYGRDVDRQLAQVSEMIGADAEEVQGFIMAWRAELTPNEVYRRSTVQNRLLDLWGMLQSEMEAEQSILTV